MVDVARARKLADRIKVVVAETLETRIKDPRLGFITITDARVTGDLQQATVFYTVYGDDAQKADTAAALESARGVLRSEVGRQTGVRLTPTLTFVEDAVPENASHIEDLLAQVAAADAEVHRAAAGAAYAGDADPYKAPRDEADDADGPGGPGGPGGPDDPDGADGADEVGGADEPDEDVRDPVR